MEVCLEIDRLNDFLREWRKENLLNQEATQQRENAKPEREVVEDEEEEEEVGEEEMGEEEMEERVGREDGGMGRSSRVVRE